MRTTIVLVALALACSACVVDPGRTAGPSCEAEDVAVTGEASTAGEACRAACAAAFAALCLQVKYVCDTAESVTLGGATVPCAIAVGIACIGGVALASVCSGRCGS
jgi:hypothetical protein